MKKENNTEAHERTPPKPLTVEVDLTRYAIYLKEFDLTEDEANEMLMTLWTMLQSFVDLGFGVAPSSNTCGQTGRHTLVEVSPVDQSAVDSLKPIIADTLEETVQILAEKVRQS